MVTGKVKRRETASQTANDRMTRSMKCSAESLNVSRRSSSFSISIMFLMFGVWCAQLQTFELICVHLYFGLIVRILDVGLSVGHARCANLPFVTLP